MPAIETEGFKELENMLSKLPQKVAKKTVRRSAKKALKPLLEEIKPLALDAAGVDIGLAIVENLKVKAPKRQKPGQYVLTIQILPDIRLLYITKKNKRHYLPSAIEFGHGADKESAARPFMRKAADAGENRSIKIFSDDVAAGIEREAKLLVK